MLTAAGLYWGRHGAARGSLWAGCPSTGTWGTCRPQDNRACGGLDRIEGCMDMLPSTGTRGFAGGHRGSRKDARAVEAARARV